MIFLNYYFSKVSQGMLNFCKKSGSLETTQRNIPWKEELFNGLRLHILELEWYAVEFSIHSSRKKWDFFPIKILLFSYFEVYSTYTLFSKTTIFHKRHTFKYFKLSLLILDQTWGSTVKRKIFSSTKQNRSRGIHHMAHKVLKFTIYFLRMTQHLYLL